MHALGKLENRRAMQWLGHFSLPLLAPLSRARSAQLSSSATKSPFTGALRQLRPLFSFDRRNGIENKAQALVLTHA
jgi:hypothetical protein